MKQVRFNPLRTWLVWFALLCLPVAAQAGIAERVERAYRQHHAIDLFDVAA